MKKNKSQLEQTTNLMHAGKDEPDAFYERQITATFENGGAIQVMARGESIAGVIEIILAVVPVLKLDRELTLDVTLRYWHLTEDFQQVEISGAAYHVSESSTDAPQAIVRRLAADAKVRLVKNLARHQIALVGERGELA
ncbi:MAG: hypothetical protein ABSH15_04435 [Verrucomicrobiota bacterium]|jgi:hypothetical protein